MALLTRRRASLALSTSALLALLPACEPMADDLDFVRQEVQVTTRSTLVPPADPTPATLKVMAWNVKYGAARIDFWFDYWGDRVQMTRQEVVENMADLYRLVNEYDPDILMTEEIEVNSKRSAYYDMVQGMLEGTSLNYAAYIQTWNSRYIPSEGVGRMDLGNAIFSKYPITFAERIRQEDRTDQDGITAKFYIHRMIGRAVIDVGAGRDVAAYVVHTEAYDVDGTKGRQIQQIYDEIKKETLPFVLGGDFNELPPTALKLVGFPDEHPSSIGTEYEQPPYTPEIMQKFYDDYVPWVSLEAYGATEAEQRRFFTHTVAGPLRNDETGQPQFWNRTLDYLFVTKADAWAPSSTDVLQEPGRQGIKSDPLLLSDHAPVVGTWVLGGGTP
ncbi:endonuclease/exonuclease/phosphatase family protein [Polyangium sp. 6x1]|uniref:endonuclease/exonuclease/phosphatase family protein n=1 Tax=Polyangium sp. 6x1 TaxID=3042689 RepID=UPI0024825064|nr:endonuclease/exonuclease/phosphatase family protein [Polyangium sp. 6x1]MDI1450850.1 endonuclease/exonuclease/phosphatase family protein [Polyangium sp. 6x1]